MARLVRMAGLGGAVWVCAGAWATGPASANGTGHFPSFPGSVLHVSASGPLTEGSVMTITGTGTNASKPGFAFQFDVFLVAPILGPCKTAYNAELTIYYDNPRRDIFKLAPIQEGGPQSGGPFRITTPIVLNGGGTGQVLICAYSGYGESPQDDVAWASTEVTIRPAAAKKPAVIKQPR